MDKIHEILSNAKKVLVTSHLQPDPDAICSALGMYDYILKAYPNAQTDIYLNGQKLEAYTNLKNYDDVKWIPDLSQVVNQYDTLVFTDASQLSRFIEDESKIDLSKFKTICIDHHNNQVSKFDALIWEPEEPSASQLIYSLFFRNRNHLIDPNVAEVLLTGILSDTLMLAVVKANSLITFDYVKELIEITNLEIQQIKTKYFGFTKTDWEIISILTKNITKVDDVKNPFIYSYLPMECLSKYSLNEVKQGRAKFQVLFATSILGYNWGFVLNPHTPEVMNISFRSTPGSVNVRLLAEKFGGGGHDMTSGGEFPIVAGESSDQVALKIVEKFKSFNLELAV